MVQEGREAGPGSEAELRFRCLQLLGELGMSADNQERRRSPNRSYIVPRLTSHPLAQAAWPPPRRSSHLYPKASRSGVSGRGERQRSERLILRIGVEPVSWIATFERGSNRGSTVQLMPGDAHFFVSASGAGYIIEALTRTLVEKVGDDVVSVVFDEDRTRFFVNQDDRRLEAFGPSAAASGRPRTSAATISRTGSRREPPRR
jgi:hypothetical protein